MTVPTLRPHIGFSTPIPFCARHSDSPVYSPPSLACPNARATHWIKAKEFSQGMVPGAQIALPTRKRCAEGATWGGVRAGGQSRESFE
eukprot:365224-Chlamydomonas_euryale.AAC.6